MKKPDNFWWLRVSALEGLALSLGLAAMWMFFDPDLQFLIWACNLDLSRRPEIVAFTRIILVVLASGALYTFGFGFFRLAARGAQLDRLAAEGTPDTAPSPTDPPATRALKLARQLDQDWDQPLLDDLARHRRVSQWTTYLANAMILLGLVGNFVGLALAIGDMASALESASAASTTAASQPSDTRPLVREQTLADGSSLMTAAQEAELTTTPQQQQQRVTLRRQVTALAGVGLVVVGSVLGIGGMIVLGALARALAGQAEELYQAQMTWISDELGPQGRLSPIDAVVAEIRNEVQGVRDSVSVLRLVPVLSHSISEIGRTVKDASNDQKQLVQSLQTTNESFDSLRSVILDLRELPESLASLSTSMQSLKTLAEGPLTDAARNMQDASKKLAEYTEEQAKRNMETSAQLTLTKSIVQDASKVATESTESVNHSKKQMTDLVTRLEGIKETLSASKSAIETFLTDAVKTLSGNLEPLKSELVAAAQELKQASQGLADSGDKLSTEFPRELGQLRTVLDKKIVELTDCQKELVQQGQAGIERTCRNSEEQLARIKASAENAENLIPQLQRVLNQVDASLQGLSTQGDRLVNQTLDRLSAWIDKTGNGR